MHVAVLGAGYAGLSLVRRLERDLPPDVDLTLVDERDTHLVQHLVHRVIRRPDLADELTRPIVDVLDRAQFRQARVKVVDPDAGTAVLDAEPDLSFDVGAVCLGSRTDFHGLPGVEAHATPCKRLTHAKGIRRQFLTLCEDVEDGAATDDRRRVIVGGAGLAGVQVAGELAALARERDADDDVDVCLLEREGAVAPTQPPVFREAVADELQTRGVTVETGKRVTRAEDDRVVLADGTERPYDQFVWTGGVTGPVALGDERPRVRARLRLGECTLGLGDAVRVVDADGRAVPPSAQTALGQAAVAATNVRRLVEHRRDGSEGFEPRLSTYRTDVRGWLVTVGDGAVASVGPSVLRGRAARTLKASVGERYLQSVDPDRDLATVVRNAVKGHG